MAYRLVRSGSQSPEQTAEQPQTGFGHYNPRGGEMAFGAAKSVARGAEKLFDVPGNIVSPLLAKLGDLLTGQNIGQQINQNQEPQQSNVDFFGDLIGGKGYGNPQSKFEQYGQRGLEEVAPTAILGGAGNFAKNARWLAGTNALSAGLQEGLNVPENYAEATKIGAQLARGIVPKFTPAAIEDFIGKSMNSFEKLIPSGLKMSSKPISSTLNNVANTLSERVVSSADKKEIHNVLKTVENNISGGNINISKIPNITKDINKTIYKHGADPLVKHLLGKVQTSLNDTFKDFIGKNPQYKGAYNYYNDLKETWKTLKTESNTTKLANYLTDKKRLGILKIIGSTGPYIPGVGVTKGAAEGLELIGKNPATTRILGNVAGEAITNPQITQNIAAQLPSKLSNKQTASTIKPQGKYRLRRNG